MLQTKNNSLRVGAHSKIGAREYRRALECNEMNHVRLIANQLRLIIEIGITEAIEVFSAFFMLLIRGIVLVVRVLAEKVLWIFEDPFRALFVVWTVVLLLVMTR